MDIDMRMLRDLAQDREISLDLLYGAIEQALLHAYEHTEGARSGARVELDRKSGHVTVFAKETDEAGAPVGLEFDDTPSGFGRIAASTAKQVILQRLREDRKSVV